MAKRKKKDHRTANLSRRQGVREVKQSFLIVCEGENTEPDYFRAFRMTTAKVLHFNLYRGAIHRNQYKDMLVKLIGMPYGKTEGFGTMMYNLLLARQEQAIKNSETVLAEIAHGNPAEEESSTTVHILVKELNKYI